MEEVRGQIFPFSGKLDVISPILSPPQQQCRESSFSLVFFFSYSAQGVRKSLEI